MPSIEQLLFHLYADNRLIDRLHLQGGAALALVYGMNRVFSNDLDFTVDDEQALNALLKILLHFGQQQKLRIHKQNSRVTFFESSNNKEVFHLDVCIVPPSLCEYSKIKYTYRGAEEFINVHSINDLFIEKIYCTLTRCEIRDIKDILLLIKSEKVQVISAENLFERKQSIKQSEYSSLLEYQKKLEDIQSRYISKFPLLDLEIRNIFFNINLFIKHGICDTN